ncbi:MAG: hypothetical protein PHH37_08330 [Paludibacter sp.]|nr:hypothetical protein [Paludibacter sp.]
MKPKIILILIIALAVVSCKTVRQSQSATLNTSTDMTVNQSSEQNNNVKVQVDSSNLVIDKGQVSEATTEETTTVVYSPVVDSITGKQAVVSVSTTTRKIIKSELKNLQQTKLDNSKITDNTSVATDLKSITSAQTNSSKKNITTSGFKMSGWLIVIKIILILAILISVYFLFKRYKIYSLCRKKIMQLIHLLKKL